MEKSLTVDEVLVSVGEYLITEFEEVEDIKYTRGEGKHFSLVMKNGEVFGVYVFKEI